MEKSTLVSMIPLSIFLGLMIWLVWRGRRSYRVQEQSAARQEEMMEPFYESVKLQKEGVEIQRAQLEATQALKTEIEALREELKK